MCAPPGEAEWGGTGACCPARSMAASCPADVRTYLYHKIAKARFRTNAAESPVTSKPSHFGLSQNGPDMDPFPTFPRRVFIFLRRRLCVSDLSVVAACASNLSTSVRDK